MGCATQRELIEKRIGQRPNFFASLPAEDQQRLREGKLVTGDSRDAAYIVYGRPDRISQKPTATSTNEVWSYVVQDIRTADDLRPDYRTPRPTTGGTAWRLNSTWATDNHKNPYEYRRIEFQNDRVLTHESESR
jgi:hypothetical protein